MITPSDVCGGYIILDSTLLTFTLSGFAGEFHSHAKCRPIVEGESSILDWPKDGPVRKAWEEINGPTEEAQPHD